MHPASDCTLASFAPFILSIINTEVMLEIARFSIGFDKVSQCRPALLHSLLENFLDPKGQVFVTAPGNSSR